MAYGADGQSVNGRVQDFSGFNDGDPDLRSDKVQDKYGNFFYGGSKQGAVDEAQRSADRAAGWENRYAQQMGPPIDYQQANAMRDQAQASRGEQQYGLALAQQQMEGRGPSAATLAAQGNMEQAALQQAQAMGMGQTGAAQLGGMQAIQQAAQGAGSGLSAEQNAGRGAFLGGAGDLRAGDYSQAGQDLSRQAAMADAYAQQRALADQMAGYYENQDFGQAQFNSQQDLIGTQQQAQRYGEAARHKQAGQDRADRQVAGAVNTAASLAGTMAKSDGRQKYGVASLAKGGR